MLRRVGLGLLVAGLLLGLAEAILRVAVPEDALLFRYERSDALLLVDDRVGVKMREGGETWEDDGPYRWRARANAAGFREDAEVPTARGPGVERRLVALGDSWIYGYSVTQGKTIPDVVEALLPGTEVVNAGIFGGSAFEAARRWQALAGTHEVDGVILGLPHNDARQRDLADTRTGWGRVRDGGPASRLRLYLGLRLLLAPVILEPWPTLHDVPAAMSDVAVVIEGAAARGLPVWFLLFPFRWDDGSGRPLEGDFARWEAFLARYPVTVVRHPMNERACWAYRDLAHPGEAGARAWGEALAAAIEGKPPVAPPCVDLGPYQHP